MRTIKFRQPSFHNGKFNGWHYWGFISDGRFDGIQTGTASIKEARETSQQYTGLKDKNGVDGYHKDIAEGWGDWLIEWDENEGGFYLKSIVGYDKLPLRKLKEMNIIGNIYEEAANG